MEKLKIYLDTSVINFLFADDAPEKKEMTEDFFENFIKINVFDTLISDFVIQEINQTQDLNKQQKLLRVIDNYPIEILESKADVKIVELADLYVNKGIIPAKKKMDALHIAFVVVEQIDYLVSWNYKHLANVNRERKILALNIENAYFTQ